MLDRLTNSLDFQAQALNLRAERQRLTQINTTEEHSEP